MIMILGQLRRAQIVAFSSRVAPSLGITAFNKQWAGWNVTKKVVDERKN